MLLGKIEPPGPRALREDPLIGGDRRTPEPGANQVRCYIGATPKRDLDPLIAEARG